ncbi:hypothetical protein GCM10028778_19100 [Barrientosiimonas marina]|uniref:Small, acid-soluble spore protein gamma-type n=1 Tax=Lentibacillus kimchii TaxID=1542911 RepID=A0ABW2UQJ9_9BACI
MAKNKQPNQTKTGTNVEDVKKQNQQAKQGQYETEYAAETDVQSVKERNKKSEQNKK